MRMQACRRFATAEISVTTQAPSDSDPTTSDFERSLAELEQIVERLEQGDLTLEESLRQFERGVQLTRQCQTALKDAEHKVEILLRKNADTEQFERAAFDPSESDED